MLRRDKREPIDKAHLNLSRSLENKKQYYDLIIQNISRGGLCFASDEIFDVDEHVEIQVFQDKKEIHQALGRICYCTENKDQENTYGISFLDNYLSI